MGKVAFRILAVAAATLESQCNAVVDGYDDMTADEKVAATGNVRRAFLNVVNAGSGLKNKRK